MRGLILSFAFLTAFVGVSYQDKVPVLIWSNDRSLVLPHPLAGHTISKDNFVHQYLDVLGTDASLNVVLFVQDKLNLNDITQNAAVYDADDEENDSLKQIKKIMTSMSVAQLPSVDSPMSAIAELKSHFSADSIHELQAPFTVESLTLNQSSHNMLIIRLPELRTGEPLYQKSLQKIDEIVDSVTSQLKKLPTPFVAVYTAASSDKGVTSKWSNVVSKRSGRQLLGTAAPPTAQHDLMANVSGLFMLYMDNMTLSNGIETFALSTVSGWSVVDDATICSNSSANCTVVMSYNNGTEDALLSITAQQTSGSNVGYWYVSAISMNYSAMGVNASFSPAFVELTPIGYSWHCAPTVNISQLGTLDIAHPWTMAFVNIQIQAFGLKAGQGFGYYNDCTCFFTIAIWMGLISSAVMIAILLFGICMLMSIKTMDRFDDPKGKTITVTATD